MRLTDWWSWVITPCRACRRSPRSRSEPVPLEDDPVPFIGLRRPPDRSRPRSWTSRPLSGTRAGGPPGSRTPDQRADSKEGVEPCRHAHAGADAPTCDRHGRRAVWITWLVTLVVAAVVYAGKAAEDRSAFIRWRHQVLDFWDGVNIWTRYMFPNPPIFPLTLYPLICLPPVAGALTWFALKAGLMPLSVALVLPDGPRARRQRPSRRGSQALVLLLSFRPILSDLHHGNINIMILFLIVATSGPGDGGTTCSPGCLLGLAITYKVTPALFVPYFVWKRSRATVRHDRL